MDRQALTEILVAKNKTIEAERAAVASGAWATYLAERVPPPSPELLAASKLARGLRPRPEDWRDERRARRRRIPDLAVLERDGGREP